MSAPPTSTPELLAQIFVNLELEDLLPLQRVSRVWYHAIRDAPQYWRDINLVAADEGALRPGEVQFFLKRLTVGGYRTLNVTFEAPEVVSPDIEGRVLPTIMGVLHRTELLRLEVNVGYGGVVCESLRTHAAPYLHTLDLAFIPQHQAPLDILAWTIPHDILAGHAPRLTKLVLFEALLPPAHVPAFVHVHAAEMYSQYCADPAALDLERIFVNLPALEELTISFGAAMEGWSGPTSPAIAALVRTRARQLRSLNVTGFERSFTQWLLLTHPVIRIPDIIIIDEIDSPALELFGDLTTLLTPPYTAVVSHYLEDELIVSDGRVKLTLRGGMMQIPDYLSAIFSAGPVPVAPGIQLLDIPMSLWDSLCAAGITFPSLNILFLRGNSDDFRSATGALRCPALNEVTFYVDGPVGILPGEFVERNLVNLTQVPRTRIVRN